MSSHFRRVCAMVTVVGVLASPSRAIGQTSGGCGQPTSGSGLILGRALQDESYKGKRASLGMDNFESRSIRALTDPDSTATCDRLRQMLKRWPGRAPNTEFHFFSGNGFHFVTVEQIRNTAEERETLRPQLVVVRDNRLATMFVRRR